MPPLKGTLTKEEYEGLDPGVKGAYVAAGDGFALDVPPPEDTAGLKSALERLKTERTELRTQVDAERNRLKELGIEDPAELERIVTEDRARRDKKLLDEGQVEEFARQREEAAVKRLRTASEKERNELLAERDALRSRLNKEVIDRRVLAHVASIVAPGSAKDDVVRRAREVFSVGADGVEHAVGTDGTILRGEDGQELTIAAWVDDLRTEAPHLFKPTTGSGASGANGSDAPGAATNLRRSAMTHEQKAEYIDRHGRDAYEQLPF